MSNLQENKNINYDDEPVEYCSRCYSLKIVHEDSIDADCCMECGSTDISSASIDTWEKLYEKDMEGNLLREIMIQGLLYISNYLKAP